MTTTDTNENSLSVCGLTQAQVEESRRAHGANVLTPPARDPWWKLYLEKFRDPIIRILMAAAVIALLVGLSDGSFIEGIGIVVAIVLSTGLSFFNEYKAGKEFDILNQVSDEEEFAVVRDGGYQRAAKKDLVVGDVVLVETGAEFPADADVIESVSLSANESSLTGESAPVAKFPETPDRAETKEHAYPTHRVLRGTTVADGHGMIRLIAVGDMTEIGKTARAASESTNALTPLGKQLERLAGLISIAAFVAAGVIFIAQIVRGAANGELHDVAEIGGRLVGTPLSDGQWYCLVLMVLSLGIASARLWLPTLREGLRAAGREAWIPEWIILPGKKGVLWYVGGAAVLFMLGAAVGLSSGALRWSGQAWLPLSAIGGVLRYFMVAVTVIVVAVPEGLPMCVTLALAYSMRKMTATNNLVRKMHACETIGAASVICSDKTGTLTMNQMRVDKAVFPFMGAEAKNALDSVPGRMAAEAISVNSTAHLERRGDVMAPLGNPTESALLLWLDGLGKEYGAVRKSFALARQLTFTTERKFMATSGVSAVTGGPVLFVKGAPEIILARCVSFRNADGESASPLTETKREAILEEVAGFQNRGMRIIALADREARPEELNEDIDAGITGLVWTGFFAIADPIRPEVPEAIHAALGAGVAVKIVTGDNQATAREIARQAGLWTGEDTDENIITGDVFESLSDEEAALAAGRIKIMARARPLHKLRLVNLLQARGDVVAVTGDGTNDAPALNHADVGLAMGITGTSVAKEAADIILLDDSFNSIVNAVAWGRSLYANIQKFCLFQLTINVAAVGIALLGPFLGITLPLTVVQMLWVNLIMDTFAALALASEPPDWDLMKNSPRAPDAFIITPPMRKFILSAGLAFLLLFLLAVTAFRSVFSLDPETAVGRHNLTVFFTCFVFLQFWNLFNARVFGSFRSAFHCLRESRGFVMMAGIILLGQILLVQFGGEMFRVTPLGVKEWVLCFVLTSPVLWIGEAWRLHKRSSPNPDYWVYSSK